MKIIARQLQKLEDRFGARPDTETERHWRTVLEEGRQRAADFRAHCGLPPLDTTEAEQEDLSGLTVIDILNRGRIRAAARFKLAQQEVRRRTALVQ